MNKDTKITHLSHRCSDGTKWTVEQMLEDALSDLREHRRAPTKAIVIFLDDESLKYDVGFSQAGLSLSQAISLIEVAKSSLLREIGY